MELALAAGGGLFLAFGAFYAAFFWRKPAGRTSNASIAESVRVVGNDDNPGLPRAGLPEDRGTVPGAFAPRERRSRKPVWSASGKIGEALTDWANAYERAELLGGDHQHDYYVASEQLFAEVRHVQSSP